MGDWQKLLAMVGLCVASTCGAEEEPSAAQLSALEELLRSEPIAVVGLAKELNITDERSDWLVRACQAWTLHEADVRQFFKLGATINAVELHHGYSVAPCDYRGSILISNQAFDFRLNGGAFAYIHDTSNDLWYSFGCQEPCTSLFELFGWTSGGGHELE